MAILSDNDRAALVKAYGSELSGTRTLFNLTKAELRAAINAIDQWADDNASEFNLAIPQPARGVLTTKQKAALLMYVINRRHEVV